MSDASAPADDRQVPFSIRIAYEIGSIADGAKNSAFNAFLVLYYTTVLGLPGTLGWGKLVFGDA
jgi:Na+/melibiose symporter-like transporter